MVGDSGVGKSTFLQRHMTGIFQEEYMPTICAETHPLIFHTKDEPICCNVWDIAGQEKLGGLRDGYYTDANAVIVMFDLDNRISIRNAQEWLKDVERRCGSIPVVFCGNKADIQDRKIGSEDEELVSLINTPNMKYYDISTKNRFNLEEPFLYLINQLT